MVLRDAQVLPIWEGTTNVLELDTLRALGDDGMALLRTSVASWLEPVTTSQLAEPVRIVKSALDHATSWARKADEAGARRFALTLGRTMELALLIRHAQWSRDEAISSARRFARSGVDLI